MTYVAPEHRTHWQMFRYLMVGAFNTGFGYSLFALLNYAFRGLGAYSYILASLLGNVIAVTVAFLGYKWFVFKTSGNYLREWIRCLGVYSGGILITLVGLPILVPLLRRILSVRPQAAPYVAGAIMMVVVVVVSFFGHKRISFAVSENGAARGIHEEPADR